MNGCEYGSRVFFFSNTQPVGFVLIKTCYPALCSPLAEKMCDRLQLRHESLDSVGSSRVYRYYLPVFQWCRDQLVQHKPESGAALVIGINAPQVRYEGKLLDKAYELFSDFFLKKKLEPVLEDHHRIQAHILALTTRVAGKLQLLPSL